MRPRSWLALTALVVATAGAAVWFFRPPGAGDGAPPGGDPERTPEPLAEAPPPRAGVVPDGFPPGQPLALEWRARLDPRGARVYSMDFGHDGTNLVIGGWEQLSVADLRTGRTESVARLTTDNSASVLARSRDGAVLATVGAENELLIWNTADWTHTRLKADGHVTAAAFTADGRTVFAVHGTAVSRWSTADGTRVRTAERVARDNQIVFGRRLAVTPDGKTVATVVPAGDFGREEEVALLDGETLQVSKRLRGEKWIQSIVLSPDGRTLAVIETDAGSVRLWDITSGATAGVLRCDRQRLREIAFSPTGRYLAVTGEEFSVWEVATRARVARCANSWDSNGLTFSSDGTVLAGGDSDRRGVVLWDLRPALGGRSGSAPRDRDLRAVAPGGELALLSPANESVELWTLGADTSQRVLPESAKFAAFSPDGKRLARPADEKRVSLTDPTTGRTEAVLEVGGWPTAFAFSSDGGRLAVLVDERRCEVWHVGPAGPKRERAFEVPGKRMRAVYFSPDGRALALGTEYAVVVCDAATGTVKWSAPAHESRVSSVAYSPDGSRVLSTANGDRTARVWDAATGTELAALRHDDVAPGSDWKADAGDLHAVFGPDAGTVVTHTADGRFHLWDTATATRVGVRFGQPRADVLACTPDRKHIVSTSRNAFRVWAVDSFRRAAFAPVGAFVRDPFAPPPVTPFVPPRAAREVRDTGAFLAYSANGGRLISVGGEGQAVVWDEPSGKEVARFTVPRQQGPTAYALSHDGGQLAVTRSDGTVRLFDTGTGAEVRKLEGHKEPALYAAFERTGKWLATGNSGPIGTWLLLWNPKTGERERQFEGKAWMDKIALAPDGKWLVANGQERTSVFDMETGAERELKGAKGGSAVAVSPDGRLIALSGFAPLSDPSEVTVWDAATGKLLHRLPLDAEARNIAFGPDGLLVTSTYFRGTHLWDARTGRSLARLAKGGPFALAPDGNTLAVLGFLGDVEFYDLALAREARKHRCLEPALTRGRVERDGELVRVELAVRGPDSDAALRALAAYPGPLALSLKFEEGFPDSLGRVLADLTALRRLALVSRADEPPDLNCLKNLMRLEELDLSATGATPEGLRHLSALVALRRLNLSGTKATDAALAQFKGFAHLTELDLSGTLVTDAGLAHLTALKALRTLRVGRTDVTAEGVARLRKAVPNLAVNSD